MPRVLHLLSQRPSLTGSGVTLDALVRHAARSGWDQHVVVGVPTEDRGITIQDLTADRVHPLFFGGEGETGSDLPFPVAGMSDVMPYPSTRFSSLGSTRIETYRDVWRRHLGRVVAETRPDMIHSHHVWLMSALLKDIAEVPVVTHCHATGLRQMALCPHLAEDVRAGCRRNDRFVVLHGGHARDLAGALDVAPERIAVVGAGYREGFFHRHPGSVAEGWEARRNRLVYVGKLAAAKGVPWLLDAFERLAARRPGLELHVAGAGGGEEGDALRRRMEAMGAERPPRVVFHGMLGQKELAGVLRRCSVCVLPSFYEGLPLVLVEALACGCRLVSTELPGVIGELAPHLGEALDRVPLPRLESVDRPVPDDLPAFVEALTETLGRALDKPPLEVRAEVLQPFTWGAVFQRVEAVWRGLVNSPTPPR